MRGTGPSLRIEKASNGGHTMTLHPADKPAKKGGMEIGRYEPPETRVYGPGDHEKMIGDARAHLGITKPKLGTMPKAVGLAKNMAAAGSTVRS